MNGSLETRVQDCETTSVPVTTVDNADNCLSADSPDCSSNAAYENSRTVANGDINTSEVYSFSSERAPNCYGRDVSAKAIGGDVPQVNVDETAVIENDRSSAKTSEYFHRTDDSLLDSSVHVEPAESQWQNFGGDRISDGDNNHCQSPPQNYPLLRETIQYQSFSESTSAVGERVMDYDTDKTRSTEAVANRKRRISAARSALYRRLLSSDTASGSADVDVSSDIFDLRSLSSSSSDDDGDDDVDSGSDHSYLVIYSAFVIENQNSNFHEPFILRIS